MKTLYYHIYKMHILRHSFRVLEFPEPSTFRSFIYTHIYIYAHRDMYIFICTGVCVDICAFIK